jgi:thiol:disulfide interchange protein
MRYLPLIACGLLATVVLQAEPEYPKMGPDIYDTQASGVVLISAALKKAKSEQKHVLLKFGANWCIWCRRLHDTFERNDAVRAVLEKNYVLVQIDVNHRGGKSRNEGVDARYGNPSKLGLPALVVLDADGKQLTTQETGALENGKSAHDPAKVVAFLQKWAPR